jgi:hypothetical protein
MKSNLSAVCVLAVVLLATALAGTRTPSSIHPESLARIEAITSYCGKADPKSESQYLAKLAGLTHDHSEDEILGDRNTSTYRQAMAQANETLLKVSQITGARACAEFLAENQ